MKTPHRILAAAAILAAGAAFAHSDVENEAVKARMDLMSTIGMNMKTIGDMAKGERMFDAAAARSAAATIAEKAGMIAPAFEPEEDDPESEAKAEIWDNWPDFVEKAAALEAAAESAAARLDGAEALPVVMSNMGSACGGCHEAYKE
ncbi:cytochrome c [Psychromarinibacter sp. C21-152]|uniref:Cytochrome c n=1 Tax=Psychromarinibacter sediminicola TaxID=3033385 RepID=A0AAE3T8C5_9RHOB|nr:cytochrome c [Psychromarinibacter sediminicola]MDF0599335.1 cytochrome c [Psychromarinibacter sediminicola]